MAPAQPATPPTPDPLSPADNEFPDPFAETQETGQPAPSEQTDGLPTPELEGEQQQEEKTPESAQETTELTAEEPETVASLENEVDVAGPSDEPEQANQSANGAQIQSLKRAIHSMQDQLASMLRTIQMMQGASGSSEQAAPAPSSPNFAAPTPEQTTGDEQIIEGVFDGMQMVGPDGKTYSIPPNYASKSKLVEGDFMKLTITPSGKFLYKQIGPIERKRIVGELVQGADEEQWSVLAEGRPYHVLKASVTFHNARPGDEVVILVPKDGESSWGAVENVMHK